jgi:acyl carrier protein
MASIEETVLGILSGKAKKAPGGVALDTPLDEAGIDSLSLIEIIFELEDAFDITIPDPATVEERKGDFRTAGDVVAMVRTLIEAKESAP